MAASHLTFVRDGDACKSKWNQLILEYKRIANYFRRSGIEVTTYWTLQQEWRKSQGLPRTFLHEVFFQIHEWYGRELEIRPPHGRDYYAPEDTIYQIPQNASMHVNDEEVFEDADQQMQNNSDGGVDGEGNQKEGVQESTGVAASEAGQPRPPVLVAGGQKDVIGTLQSPIILSLSHTPAICNKSQPENTRIKRKTKKGHTMIAEATRASGDTVAKQMREESSASHELERAKLEAQNKFFSDQIQLQTMQLEFQKEKEARMQENVTLSIMSQQEMVQCPGALADALKQGLTPSKVEVTDSGPVPSADVRTVHPPATSTMQKANDTGPVPHTAGA